MADRSTSTNQTVTDSGCAHAPRCRYCYHSHLIQYDQNPVLAECMMQPQAGNTRFPYKVEVANVERNCKPFKYDPSPKEIEHRTRHKKEKAA